MATEMLHDIKDQVGGGSTMDKPRIGYVQSAIVGVTFRPQFALGDGLPIESDDIRTVR
jgi:hypothetical protein